MTSDADDSRTTPSFPVTDTNRVRRVRDRGHYDRSTIYDILDRGLVAHVAFVDEGRPVVMPMAYGRDGDVLYLHSAKKGRFSETIAGEWISVAVTLVDGIVVARSMFESSMNYRSIVVHGRAVEVKDDAGRLHGLRCVSEHNIPGRWDEVRAPYENELKATVVLRVTMEEVSAKVRQGPPLDDYDERDDRVWIGVVPIVTAVGAPIADGSVPKDVPMPGSVSRIRKG